jgi:RNA polymerase sigma factor (sigma-70 family)
MRLTTALQHALAPFCDTSDAELLRRFSRDRNEAAFHEIVRRYEPLVRGASRRLTRDCHAVDDAVQTTFLTLARKAHAIRHAEALPSWLYRVARSVTARVASTIPVTADAADPVDPAPSPLNQLTAREVVAIFDEELACLSAAYRSAILLCTVEGHTVGEAARQLGATPGAVRGWLQRGRDQLRRRLSERGVELSVALSFLLLHSTAGASGPVRDDIVRAAVAYHRPAPSAARLLAGSSAVRVASVAALVVGVVVALVSLAPDADGPQPTPSSVADARPKAEADTPAPRETLPEGAVARIGSPRLRHADEVFAMAFSHDGRWLATASPGDKDKSVRVWDLTNGAEKHRIPIAINPRMMTRQVRPVAVAFSEDDKRLLVLDAHEFRTFDVATGKKEVAKVLSTEKDTPGQPFQREENIIGTRFSPDAKTFAFTRRNGELVLGDTATGEVKRTINFAKDVPESERTWPPIDIVFTPSGSEVCVPIMERPMPIFDTATGESKRSLPKEFVPQYGSPNLAAFTADGRQFISIVATPEEGRRLPIRSVSVADVATGKALRTIPMPPQLLVLSVSPNGKLLAVATQANRSMQVRILDLESGKELQSMPLSLSASLVTFSPDSRLLAGTCHFDGRVTVWDIRKNALHPQSADENMLGAGFDRAGRVVVHRDRRRVTIDWRSGKVLEDKANEQRQRGAMFAQSEDGTVHAELDVSKDKPAKPLTILVKQTATGRTVARLEGLSDYPWGMSFADRNQLLVTVTQDHTLSVWDVAAGRLLFSD